MKKVITFLMICILTCTIGMSSLAENKNTLNFIANIKGTFEVTLPHNIALTESQKTVPYTVKADISNKNLLLISIKNNIRLTDEYGNVYDATLSNTKNRYESNEITETNEQSFTITAEGLPAGSWIGNVEVIISSQEYATESAGLYDENGALLATWDELVNNYGLDVEKNYDGGYDTASNPTSPVNVLKNFPTAHTLVISGSVPQIGKYVFYETVLPKVVLMEGVSLLNDGSFFVSTIDEIVFPESLRDINYGSFQRAVIKTLKIPKSTVNIGKYVFSASSIDNFSIDEENAYYSVENNLLLNEDKTRAMYAVSNSATEYVIPEGIKELDSLLFYNYENITNITLPESLEIIGNQVFFATGISTIHIPQNVKSVGQNVFSFTDNLTSITVDENNQYFCSKDGALYSKDMKILYAFPASKTGSYVIPEGVEEIKPYAFVNSKLSYLTLPESLKKIGGSAIAQTTIKSIKIPKNVSEIGELAFHANYYNMKYDVDAENKFFSSVDGVLYNKSKTRLICVPPNKAIALEIPEGVEVISQMAFYSSKYTSIKLPSTLKEIEYGAFGLSKKLSSLTVPNSVEKIGEYAFYNIPVVYYSGNATGSPWMAKRIEANP